MNVHDDETVVKTHDWKLVQASNDKLTKQRDEARQRIAELENALATIGEVAAGAYMAQENGQAVVRVAIAAIMDEVDTVLEGDDA